MIKHYFNKTEARKTKIRARLRRVGKRLRLSVFRANKYIYAQIIDDKQRKTLAAANSRDLIKIKEKPIGEKKRTIKKMSRKVTEAYQVGQIIAKRASQKNIKKVYFDRGAYKYHGRVKALAQGARDGGLVF